MHPFESNPHLVIGPIIVGAFVSTLLFGVYNVQTYLYYKNFPNDKRRIKVATVWFSEFADAILVWLGTYELAVSDFGHPERFYKAPIPLDVSLIFSGVIFILIQGFYAHRLKMFTKNWWLVGIYSLLALLRSVTIFITSAITLSVVNLEQARRWRYLLLTWSLSANVTCDLIVTGALTYFLWKKRGDNVFKSTTNMLDHLIKWTIQTGAVTSLFTIALIICFLTMPENWVWAGFMLIEPRLYSNSVLAALNGRKSLRTLDMSPGTLEFAASHTSGNHPVTAIELCKITKMHLEEGDSNRNNEHRLTKCSLNLVGSPPTKYTNEGERESASL